MPHLVFVYNADSGLFNVITDIAHKILSPATYSCKLCELSHSYFTVKKEWTAFLAGLDAELEFLHRDELRDRYGLEGLSLPVVLIKKNDRLENWLGSDEINACQDMEALKILIRQRLEASAV